MSTSTEGDSRPDDRDTPCLLVCVGGSDRSWLDGENHSIPDWRVIVAEPGNLKEEVATHRPCVVMVAPSVSEDIVSSLGLPVPIVSLVEPGDSSAAVHLLSNCGVHICIDRTLGMEAISVALKRLRELPNPAGRRSTPMRPRDGDMPGTWTLARSAWTLTAPNRNTIRLNQGETAFLTTLATTPGAPVSRPNLIAALGHDASYYDSRRLDTMVSRLRTKVSKEGNVDFPLRSIHAVGYAFVAPIEVHR